VKEETMATYLFQGCYTTASIAAIMQKPEDRSVIVRGLIESLGGKFEGFWLAFGEYDFVGIAQLPNAEAAAAFALRVAAGGAVHNFKTVPLLTWAEGINAFKKAASAKYAPPAKPMK
jgi:uncharacterized protein with GYD domain